MNKQNLTIIYFFNQFLECDKLLLKLNDNNYMFSNNTNHNVANTISEWLSLNGFNEKQVQDYLDAYWNNEEMIEDYEDYEGYDLKLSMFFNVKVLLKDFYEKNNRKENQLDKKEIYIDKITENARRYYERKAISIKIGGVK